jgi:hypothetical protein
MTETNCCGYRPCEISIAMADSQLTFAYCTHCERRQWFRDGQSVSLTTVTDSASRQWNRKLVAS